MMAAIMKQTPHLPAMLQLAGRPRSKETDLPGFLFENKDYPERSAGTLSWSGTPPRAVILPAGLALDPPEGLRRWLEKYTGSRLVVPSASESWVWAGVAQADLNQAALALRQLAEGQAVRQKTAPSGWMIFLYVLAGLFGLEVVGVLVSLVSSLLLR
jgi:hypothetical protein